MSGIKARAQRRSETFVEAKPSNGEQFLMGDSAANTPTAMEMSFSVLKGHLGGTP